MTGTTLLPIGPQNSYPSKNPAAYDGTTHTGQSVKYACNHPIYVSGTSPKLIYVNKTIDGTHEANQSLASNKVKAALKVGSTIYQVTFNGGSSSVTLAPGDYVVSDAVSVTIQPGDTVRSLTWIQSQGAVGAWPGSVVLYTGEGFQVNAPDPTGGLDETSLTDANGVANYSWVPMLVATRSLATKSVAIYADSIASTADSDPNKAFIVRALQARNIPYLKLGTSGDRLKNVVLGNWPVRLALGAAYCSDAICQMGVNDVLEGQTLAALKVNAVSTWTTLAAQHERVYQTTLTPLVTNGTIRTQFNQWLRDGAPIVAGVGVATGTTPATRAGTAGHPLTAYIEVADFVESSRDSGAWVSGYSADDVHPNDPAVPIMAGFDTSMFLPIVQYNAPIAGSSRLAVRRGALASR